MTIDVSLLRQLLSTPQLRPWLTTAIVDSIQYEDDTIWVSVTVPHTGLKALVRPITSYLVNGGGLWVEPLVGAEVLVAFTSNGHPENDGNVHPDLAAGFILGCITNDEEKAPEGSDRPAQDRLVLALNAGHTLLVRRKGGDNLLEVDGSGNITVTSTGVVKINAALTVVLQDGSLPVARATDAVVAGPFAGTIIAGNPKVLG